MKFHRQSESECEQFLASNHIDLKQENQQIQQQLTSKVQKLEEQLKNSKLPDAEQAKIRLQIAKLYISSGDIANSEKYYNTIGLKSIPNDEVFELQTEMLRFSIATQNNEQYQKHLELLNQYKNLSFDNQSQQQFYQALNLLLFQVPKLSNISTINQLLSNSISTFTAENIIPFEDYIQMAFLVAVAVMKRKELNSLIEKQMDNFHLVQKSQVLQNILQLLDCDYSHYTTTIQEYQSALEGHYLLMKYSGLLTDLLKSKIYEQYLKTYQSVQLVKIAEDFKIDRNQLVQELEYFIFKKLLQAKMTEEFLVRQEKDECTELYFKFVDKVQQILTKVEVEQRK
uniref:26S proteasome non-ATPase regulatory subunit 6 n=1 Tax=Trepomonas sp. PC1 TaxID=1076344 RepID=A0A146KGQ1_9EUKA|eukprot:JAP95647.1 26S proteasome non-ATPase regulatory subunit 6 [Trepomonas sp. PC1]